MFPKALFLHGYFIVQSEIFTLKDGKDSAIRGERLFCFLVLLELIIFATSAFIVFNPIPFINRRRLGNVDERLNDKHLVRQFIAYGFLDAVCKLWNLSGKGCWHGDNMPTVRFRPGATGAPEAPAVPAGPGGAFEPPKTV